MLISLYKANKTMFIIDESTLLKNPEQNPATANCVRLGKYAHYRRI